MRKRYFISSIHWSTYFYKVAPVFVEEHSWRRKPLSCLLPEIQIVGHVAHNLDYVHNGTSRIKLGTTILTSSFDGTRSE